MIAKSDFISRFAFLAKIQNLTYLVIVIIIIII